MWQIDNRTPFAVEQGWIRDRNGAELWLVVVKATFDVRDDGSLAVSEKQPAPCRVPEHHGEPGKSSIRYESDFLLTKSTTDVIVVGHAHAPGGQPVTQLDVGLRVGPVQKRLKVFGDRSWGLLGPSEPAPFVAMPLVYEPGTKWSYSVGLDLMGRAALQSVAAPFDAIANQAPEMAAFMKRAEEVGLGAAFKERDAAFAEGVPIDVEDD